MTRAVLAWTSQLGCTFTVLSPTSTSRSAETSFRPSAWSYSAASVVPCVFAVSLTLVFLAAKSWVTSYATEMSSDLAASMRSPVSETSLMKSLFAL